MPCKHAQTPGILAVSRIAPVFFFGGVALLPLSLSAAEAGHGMDGAALSLLWLLPFAGVLLSIALFPLLAPELWHRHYGKISLGWALTIIAPMLAQFGAGATFDQLLHVLLLEYLPFIVLI